MKHTRSSEIRTLKAIAWALAATFLTGLVACKPSGSQGNDSDPPPKSDSVQGNSGETAELVVLTWPEYLPKQVLERFENETGIHVVCEPIENSDEFQQLLASAPGTVDVVVTDDKTLLHLIELKLIAPLDHSKLGNFGNLSTEFLNADFDRGNIYSVPYLWGTTLLAYRKDSLPDPPKSWNLLWDERAKGRAGMIDEPEDLIHIALATLGYDPNRSGEVEIEKATELLLRQLGEQGGEMFELYTGLDALDAGDLSVLATYSGDAAAYAADNDQIGYFIPEEGAPLWIDSFAVAQPSGNTSDAHRFINFMIEAESAAQTANTLRHASPNRAATALIDSDLLDNPAIYPTREGMERCRFIRMRDQFQIQSINRGIKRIYDQLREKSYREETGRLTAEIPAGDESTAEEERPEPDR